MKLSLRSKLSLSYIFIALLSVILLSVLANVFLEKQFKDYVINRQTQVSKETVNLISQQYSNGDKWDVQNIENVGVNALEQGLIIKVIDKNGKTVWDAAEHNNGLCSQMLSHMAQNMKSRYPSWKGGYVVQSYDIKYNFSNTGKVEIGYFGPYFYTDNDLDFINTLNKAIIAVGVLSLFVALASGNMMARRISSPLLKVTKAAKLISGGYYREKILDVTDTKEINELTAAINDLADSLEKQETIRKRMSADVAHELRTPLATLQSHMEAMIDGIWEPDAKRLRSCHEEIIRIGKMVGDLEMLSRYEGENARLNKSDFDLSELIKSIVQNFENDFRMKNINISADTHNQYICADKDKISQVIINLISNALKYTPEGGFVRIKTSETDGLVKIEVEDNGQGIPDKDQPFIFERFYRVDKSRNRLLGGSGIGLAIVKTLTEAHNGGVSVQSVPGKGSVFTIELPK